MPNAEKSEIWKVKTMLERFEVWLDKASIWLIKFLLIGFALQFLRYFINQL